MSLDVVKPIWNQRMVLIWLTVELGYANKQKECAVKFKGKFYLLSKPRRCSKKTYFVLTRAMQVLTSKSLEGKEGNNLFCQANEFAYLYSSPPMAASSQIKMQKRKKRGSAKLSRWANGKRTSAVQLILSKVYLHNALVKIDSWQAIHDWYGILHGWVINDFISTTSVVQTFNISMLFFREKQAKTVDGRIKMLPYDQVNAKLFYPRRKENKDATPLVVKKAA